MYVGANRLSGLQNLMHLLPWAAQDNVSPDEDPGHIDCVQNASAPGCIVPTPVPTPAPTPSPAAIQSPITPVQPASAPPPKPQKIAKRDDRTNDDAASKWSCTPTMCSPKKQRQPVSDEEEHEPQEPAELTQARFELVELKGRSAPQLEKWRRVEESLNGMPLRARIVQTMSLLESHLKAAEMAEQSRNTAALIQHIAQARHHLEQLEMEK